MTAPTLLRPVTGTYVTLFLEDGRTNPEVVGVAGDGWAAERLGNTHAKDSDLSIVWWHEVNNGPARISWGETRHEGRECDARYEVHFVDSQEVAA